MEGVASATGPEEGGQAEAGGDWQAGEEAHGRPPMAKNPGGGVGTSLRHRCARLRSVPTPPPPPQGTFLLMEQWGHFYSWKTPGNFSVAGLLHCDQTITTERLSQADPQRSE